MSPALIIFSILVFSMPSMAKGTYQALNNESCYGYPQVSSIKLENKCVGLVADTDSIPWEKPRKILFDGDSLYVTTMGGWSKNQGQLWRLRFKNSQIQPTLIYDKLDRVHGIRKGIDGFIYIGEATRISRFHPANIQQLETVIANLPDSYTDKNNVTKESSHPLSEFIILPNGNMVVNIGAPSNDCSEEYKALGACHQRDVQAELRIYKFNANTNSYSQEHEVLARGLRNSMGLLFNPLTNEIYQAENSADTFGTPDELNIINLTDWEAGKSFDFGWPFCHSKKRMLGAYTNFPTFCNSRTDQPHLLLPAHAAPLDMIYYQGDMFPEMNGSVLISWHGHRPTGSRIAAYATDESGGPQQKEPNFLIDGWQKDPTGKHPKGRPVGMAIDARGAVFVIDDVNNALLVIAKSENENPDTDSKNIEKQTVVKLNLSEEHVLQWTQISEKIIKPLNCAQCHSDIVDKNNSSATLQNMLDAGWLTANTAAKKQSLWIRTNGYDGSRIMPPAPSTNLIHSEFKRERVLLYRWLHYSLAPRKR